MSGKEITVYMIGNAHIDPVWLWQWREGFAEVLATCRSALDRMNEYPEFIFTRADAATYRWVEDACPEMFEEIRARVKQGQWSAVGGWWEQPDCNIPCGESFVRHLLYGKRYFLEKFGTDVVVGYNVDSFGHSAGLPQILARAGIRYYAFMRPEPHERELPDSVFYWEGPDGSRVLTHRLRGPYCVWDNLGEHVKNIMEHRPAGTSAAACFYGVGNHGGGPTIDNIEWIRATRADPEAPNTVFGTLEQFFEHVLSERTDFPVVNGDLQHHAVGCYTSHAGMKTWMRRAECELTSAEEFCSMAKLALGRPFPKRRFAEAWQRVLFAQFHDVLAGTSLDVAYDDVRNSMGAALEIADYEANAALSNLSCRINVRGEGDPFVVFNPHAHEITCPTYFDENGCSLRDHTGRPLPVQTAVPFFEHIGARAKKVFVDRLPPLGYRLYYSGNWEDSIGPAAELSADGSSLENAFLRVEIEPESGSISSIFDKRAGVDVLSAPAGGIVLEDPSDTWSHGVHAYKDIAGGFADARIELVERGPVRSTLRVESSFGASTLWLDISLYAQLPILEMRALLDWREKHRMLKFEFPLAIEEPVVTADAAYAVAQHSADGNEHPMQKWVDVSGRNDGRPRGVSLINDCKYGYDCDGANLRLSVVRSPIYAFHDPREVEPGKRYHYMDQGLHSFKLALLAHEGRWQDAGTVREALTMNMPPVSLETHAHAGDWPGEMSFGEIRAENVEVCAIKETEDDGSLIVRLRETAGRPTEAVLVLGDARFSVRMGAFELKTLRADGRQISEVDLIERPL